MNRRSILSPRYYWQAWQEIHDQRIDGDSQQLRSEPIVVLTVSILALVTLYYLSNFDLFDRIVGTASELQHYDFLSSAYWIGCRVLCYGVIPLSCVMLIGSNTTGPSTSGTPLQNVGLGLPSLQQHARPYFTLLLLMLPVVVAVSFAKSFQRYYPFYDYVEQGWRWLLIWEAMYALQFIVLEFFYRGFLLFSLQRAIGAYAIFVMTIPYCMVHLGKPAIEAFAAIPAGIVLGTLALQSRSIWLGAALHIAVAWSMDLLSLWHRGLMTSMPF